MGMKNNKFKILAVAIPILSLALVLILTLTVMFQTRTEVRAEDERFTDVPMDHWAYEYIESLRQKDITTGIGNHEFGLGQTMTRAEFVTFLVRLVGWNPVATTTASYLDNADSGTWYHDYVEVAAKEGVLNLDDENFRPLDAITREEMAVMIANALGYGSLAEGLNASGSSFSDVTTHAGAIELLKNVGIVTGSGNQTYNPLSTALREEAAAILIRMHDRMETTTTHANAFYAVSSYAQMDLAESFDQISFGWASLSRNAEDLVVLETQFPTGFETPLEETVAMEKETALSVYADEVNDNVTSFLSDDKMQEAFIVDVMTVLDTYDFDGVVIDFEGMRDASLQEPFTQFLVRLDSVLGDKALTVMVQPKAHYDGYDYRGIGDVADSVILMAHDYNAKRLTEADRTAGYTYTPVTPIKQVYEALVALTDKETGVSDTSKIGLQLSFATAQWELDANGVVLNERPYTPDYEKLLSRLEQESTTVTFDASSMNPKAVYNDTESGNSYVIWYENGTSINKKVELAELFGITRLSTWRLGNIPDPDSNYPERLDMEVVSKLTR